MSLISNLPGTNKIEASFDNFLSEIESRLSNSYYSPVESENGCGIEWSGLLTLRLSGVNGPDTGWKHDNDGLATNDFEQEDHHFVANSLQEFQQKGLGWFILGGQLGLHFCKEKDVYIFYFEPCSGRK